LINNLVGLLYNNTKRMAAVSSTIRLRIVPKQQVSSEITSSLIEVMDRDGADKRFHEGYGNWAHVVVNSTRSILGDLQKYPFPDDIKNRADVIHSKMRNKVHRSKVRDQMLFYCVYCAHLELQRDCNPIQLGMQFKLTPGEVQRCDSLFSPLQTGYRPPSLTTSPLGYLPDYCQAMELTSDALEEITRMGAAVLKKDPSLLQENPQTVAAGMLRYYIVSNGITTEDPLKITRVTTRSHVTIDGMYRRIAIIDNS
jgi:hypothetical protein